MKAKLISILSPFVAVLLLSSCTTSLVNLTPERVPQNPSNIYTLSLAADFSDASVINDSITAWIVIDGEKHEMTRSDEKKRIFEYEYKMQSHRSEAKFYYEVDYQIEVKNHPKNRHLNSGKTYSFSLTDRYVISIESERGPVGAVIPVLGRGFSRFDKIVIGDFQAETKYDSPVALRFIVPPLPANDDYQVNLLTGDGNIPIAKFRIDPSQISVSPSIIALDSGGRTILLFKIPRDAPEGGLLVDITTDIPDSIIMPEVLIASGSKTINVSLEGAVPGKGSLFITAPGFDELQLPVTVRDTEATGTSVEVIKNDTEDPDADSPDSKDKKDTINYESLIIEE